MNNGRRSNTRASLASALVALLGLVLAGCGADQEQQLASEACEILAPLDAFDQSDVSGFGGAMTSVTPRFEEHQQRFRAAGFSDTQIEAAVRAECPATYRAFTHFDSTTVAAQEIAHEVCAAIAPVIDIDLSDPEAAYDAFMELSGQILLIEQRFEQSGVSDEDAEAAVLAECPEAWDAVTSLTDEPGEAQALAREVCAIIAPLAELELDFDVEENWDAAIEALTEMGDQFLELEQRFDESGLTDAEIEAAIRAECPAAWNALDTF